MDINEALDYVRTQHHAVLGTLKSDGTPQLSPVTIGVDNDGHVIISTRKPAYKVRNIRRDPRVGVTIVSTQDPGKAMRPYLAIEGTARIEEGGAPELLKTLAQTLSDPNVFPPEGAPPGFVTHIRVDKVGGIGPWS